MRGYCALSRLRLDMPGHLPDRPGLTTGIYAFIARLAELTAGSSTHSLNPPQKNLGNLAGVRAAAGMAGLADWSRIAMHKAANFVTGLGFCSAGSG